jgi:putative oxidoreductase
LPVTNIAAATALILGGSGKYSLDRALGTRLPGWLAPLGLAIIILTVLYGPSPEEQPAEAPAEEDAREGLAGEEG